MSDNVYENPSADYVHITHINNTEAILTADMKNCQLGIITNATPPTIAFKDHNGAFRKMQVSDVLAHAISAHTGYEADIRGVILSGLTSGKAPYYNGTALADSPLTISGNDISLAGTLTGGTVPWARLSDVPDPVLTLSGDASGNCTFNNLGSATLTVTVANDSHTHDSRYYTETESDSLYSAVDHIHSKLFDSSSKEVVDASVAGYTRFYASDESTVQMDMDRTNNRMNLNVPIKMGYGLNIGYSVSEGVYFDSTGKTHVNADGGTCLYIEDNSPVASGVGGEVAFRGMYGTYDVASFASIKGVKANATSGNYSGQLHLQTIANGGSMTTAMVIDENGTIATLGNFINNDGTASEGLSFDASNNGTFTENVGIGKASLENWSSTYTALQIGGNNSLMGTKAEGLSASLYIMSNAYFDGSWKRITADETSMISQGSGVIKFYTDTSGPADTAFTHTERMNIGPDGITSFKADKINIETAKTPASGSATGVRGDICFDSNYIYCCTATNVWKRSSLQTMP